MINLMYLVLTAMLALNVSSEILHAFKTINNSITNSNKSIESKNIELYEQFDKNQALPEARERVTPFNDRAKEIRAEAAKMIEYLEGWKAKIITASGGRDAKGEIKAESDIDASTRLLVEENGGDEIRKKIDALRSYMLDRVSASDRDAMNKDLPLRIDAAMKTDNNPQGDWKVGNFYNMPVMAAVTLFTKLQNDVRNSEAVIINQLFKESSADVLKFDELIGIGVPKTSYALAGQKLEGTVLLGAYNKSVTPRFSVSSGRITRTEAGVGTWEGVASGVGVQTVRGTASIDINGKTISKPFEFQYTVGTEGAALQLDQTNVIYAGIPNPATVSAAGYSLEDVSLSIEGATVTPKEKGHYEILVPTANTPELKANINVRGQGGTKSAGAFPLRIKRIPNPEASVGGSNQGFMPASTFRAQLGVVADLKDFLFPIRAQVISFQYSMKQKRNPDIIGPFTINGPYFSANPQVKEVIATARPGDKIFIEEVRAKLPDGTTRRINPVILTLN